MLQVSKKISTTVGRTNAKYELIKEGDKVLIGFSGGKDSLTLLHTLKRMQRHAPFNFEFKAVTITYGMDGENVDFLADHCKEHEIDHEIVDTNIFDISVEKVRKNSSLCSLISRMRRGYLYTHALDNGFNKLALGHHLDDSMESFFMNFFYNGAMRAMPPVYTAENGLEVIRPLIMCRERQLRGFAQDNEVEVIGDEGCPGMKLDKEQRKHMKMPHARANTKKLLAQLEEENPKIFVTMRAAFENIHTDTFFTKELLNRN
ncbi:MAG: ATP-binding protein [Campylobacterota bacterium]|nr:ATP-binding protein [Campylobacterota bacterium]